LDIFVTARWYVDDGPMLDWAAVCRSGLGWFGKNTNLLTS
jgi:epoxyqueuosine reductase QueG